MGQKEGNPVAIIWLAIQVASYLKSHAPSCLQTYSYLFFILVNSFSPAAIVLWSKLSLAIALISDPNLQGPGGSEQSPIRHPNPQTVFLTCF